MHSESDVFHIVTVNIIIMTFYRHFMISQLIYFIRAESEALGSFVEFHEAPQSKVGRVEGQMWDNSLWV